MTHAAFHIPTKCPHCEGEWDEPLVVDEPMTELLAELSRRPSREQYAILVEENKQMKQALDDAVDDGYFW